MSEWFGFLNLNKPAGWTSRQCVDHVKPLVKPAKIGHAGTLDPLATGVLIICIGPATRLVPYVHDLRKSYRAEFLLGHSSESDDTEAEVQELPNAPSLTREQIEEALPQFVGDVEQVPPVYSAVKIHGRRAYDLARRGKTPKIKPRIVTIHSLDLVSYDEPRLVLDIVCGSGTYVRSIGRDLGRSLDSGGVMSGLTRTRIGPFSIEDAIAPQSVTDDSLADQLLPSQFGLAGMSQLLADDVMLNRLQRGLRCPCADDVSAATGEEVAVLDSREQLLLIASVTDGRELQPRQVFVPKSGAP